ncbi:MAG TPA: Spy/CpxP family protein refolding chaperone [Candidatus Methylomirabilis sp.]
MEGIGWIVAAIATERKETLMTGKGNVTRWVGFSAAAMLLAGGLGAVPVAWAQQAQPAPDPAAACARRPAGLLTQDDREAIGRIWWTRVKEKVGLSDQQADEIRALLKARRDDGRADWQALCLARVALRTLMAQQTSDPAAVKAAGDQVKALQAKLMDRRLDTYLALRSKLSADQWAKWVELRKERAGHWRRRGPAFSS